MTKASALRLARLLRASGRRVRIVRHRPRRGPCSIPSDIERPGNLDCLALLPFGASSTPAKRVSYLGVWTEN